MNWLKVWRRENDASYRIFQRSLAKDIERIIVRQHYTSVIDIGCGPAYIIQSLAKKYPSRRFIGYDLYKPIIVCNRRGGRKNLSFAVRGIDNLPKKKYDLVLCLGVLHYRKRPLHDIGRLMQLVKIGGALFLNYPNRTLLDRMKRTKSADKKRFRIMFEGKNTITMRDIGKKYLCKKVRETKKGNVFVIVEQTRKR